MKIIAGKLKGRRISDFTGACIRPTSGRIKESIFNILAHIHEMKDAKVLDLFAGTGALGIEALSRGAKIAVFIDRQKKILRNIRYDLQKMGLNHRGNIFRCDILRNLNCLKILDAHFEIIFIDPPYNRNMLEPTLINLVKASVLKPESCVVVEHSVKEIIPKDLQGFTLADQRIYGMMAVSFLFVK